MPSCAISLACVVTSMRSVGLRHDSGMRRIRHTCPIAQPVWHASGPARMPLAPSDWNALGPIRMDEQVCPTALPLHETFVRRDWHACPRIELQLYRLSAMSRDQVESKSPSNAHPTHVEMPTPLTNQLALRCHKTSLISATSKHAMLDSVIINMPCAMLMMSSLEVAYVREHNSNPSFALR